MARWNQDSQGKELFVDTNPAKVELVATVPLTQTPITIASGASLSGVIDLSGKTLLGIFMPSAWTAANLTFQASLDGTTWVDVYDSAGVEKLVQASNNRFIQLYPSDWVGVRFLKVRSGTAGTAVNQGADRVLTLTTKVV